MIEFKLHNGIINVEKKCIAAFVHTDVITIILSTGDKFIVNHSYEEVLDIMNGNKKKEIVISNIFVNEVKDNKDSKPEESKVEEEPKIEESIEQKIQIPYDNMITVESLAKCLGTSIAKTEKLIASKNIVLSQLSYKDVLKILKKNRLSRVKTVESKIENGVRTNYLVDWKYSADYVRKLADMAYEPLYQTVREKYQHKCDQCDSEEKLGIHHVDFSHENMDINNLRLLCWTCHNRIHRKSSRLKVNKSKKQTVSWRK